MLGIDQETGSLRVGKEATFFINLEYQNGDDAKNMEQIEVMIYNSLLYKDQICC